jgi:hypothetical protein
MARARGTLSRTFDFCGWLRGTGHAGFRRTPSTVLFRQSRRLKSAATLYAIKGVTTPHTSRAWRWRSAGQDVAAVGAAANVRNFVGIIASRRLKQRLIAALKEQR